MFYRRDAETQRLKSVKGIAHREPVAWSIYKGFLRVSASRRLILLIVLAAAGCGVPNLEPPACVESRDIVREFYSFHFGNGLAFSADSLKQRGRFLTPEFSARLATQPEGADPFTTGKTDFPRAFRVGECSELASDTTVFELLVFWRDDNRTEQKTIRVAARKVGDEWLIDRINYE